MTDDDMVRISAAKLETIIRERHAARAEVESLRGLIRKGFKIAKEGTDQDFVDWEAAVHRAAFAEEAE